MLETEEKINNGFSIYNRGSLLKNSLIDPLKVKAFIKDQERQIATSASSRMITKQLSGINVRKPTPNLIESRGVKNTKIGKSLKNSDCKSVKQLHTKTTTKND